MKMIKKSRWVVKIYFVLLSLLVTGCYGVRYAKQLTKESISKNDSTLILKFGELNTFAGVTELLAKKRKYNIKFISFCHSIRNICYVIKDNLLVENQYAVFKVEPGTYYVRRIKLDGFGTIDAGSYDSKLMKGTIASFEIKKNEVLYIGDIKNILAKQIGFKQYMFTGQNMYIYIYDNTEIVKYYIKNNYPFLDLEQLKFQPLNFGTKSSALTPDLAEKYGIER